MKTVQVAQLKSEFSTILHQVESMGEKFIIEYGRSHRKVAMLVPFEEQPKKEREFGIYEGKYQIPDNFDEEDREINDLFYNGSVYP